jgi:PST family polysaccharide transporter
MTDSQNVDGPFYRRIQLLLRRWLASSAFRAVLQNSGWMMGEQLLRLVGAVLVGAWIARRLGVTDYGVLSHALAYVSFFTVIGLLGMNRAVVRELVHHDQEPVYTRRLLRTVIALRLAAGMLLVTGSIALSWLGHIGVPEVISIVAFGTLFSGFDGIDLYFQSGSRSRVVISYRSVVFLAGALLKVAVLLAGGGLYAIAVAVLVEQISYAAVQAYAFHRHGPAATEVDPERSGGLMDWSIANELLSYSWPEVISGLATIAMMRLDQLMLEAMVGPAEVGIYSAAVRISEAWYFVPTALVISTFPNLLRDREVNYSLYMRKIGQLMFALVLISYVAGAGALLFGRTAIRILFGSSFIRSADVMVLLIWGGLFVSLGLASGSWIHAEKLPGISLRRSVAGAILNFLLNLVLIPRYASIGAAYATLFSYALAFLFYDFFDSRMRPLSRLKWRALLLRWR